ncbi:MAG: hypothetical protein HYR85_09320 [Planctomycetes bacterium]|nr:hypothetical protein [Planctomycetota bacterium]MBI3845995.1 hypothetical protein [Planctomycetota bacterium]
MNEPNRLPLYGSGNFSYRRVAALGWISVIAAMAPIAALLVYTTGNPSRLEPLVPCTWPIGPPVASVGGVVSFAVRRRRFPSAGIGWTSLGAALLGAAEIGLIVLLILNWPQC